VNKKKLETEDTEPISLPSWKWFPFEMLIFIQLVKIFCCIEWNTKLHAVFTKIHHLSLSWDKSILSKSSHAISLRSTVILSSNLCLDLHRCSFFKGFPTKTPYDFFSVPPPPPPGALFFVLVSRALKNIRRASFPHLQRSSKGQPLCSCVCKSPQIITFWPNCPWFSKFLIN